MLLQMCTYYLALSSREEEFEPKPARKNIGRFMFIRCLSLKSIPKKCGETSLLLIYQRKMIVGARLWFFLFFFLFSTSQRSSGGAGGLILIVFKREW